MSEPLDAAAAARLVFEKGPLRKPEIRKLNQQQTLNYFTAMSQALGELGAEEFTKRRAELRAAVERDILGHRS